MQGVLWQHSYSVLPYVSNREAQRPYLVSYSIGQPQGVVYVHMAGQHLQTGLTNSSHKQQHSCMQDVICCPTCPLLELSHLCVSSLQKV